MATVLNVTDWAVQKVGGPMRLVIVVAVVAIVMITGNDGGF